jgi:hypothetical protein
MATVTPNYGWPVPQSTDLVKDGAVAIEALGDAIDATLFTLPKGKILQVQSVLMAASFTTTSSSLVDITGLTVSITPTSATSKVLVFWSVSGTSSDVANSGGNGVQLKRGTTSIAISTAGSTDQRTGVLTQRSVPAAEDNKNVAGSFLDSPATTSATTYKMQGIALGGTLFINRSTGGATGTVSTLTVMEVSA